MITSKTWRKKNRILETELEDLKKKKGTNRSAQESKRQPKVSNDYFTIGSTVDEVLEVMGDPTSYIDFGSSGKRFSYGLSTVFFEKGKVESYNNLDGNLKVRVKK